MDEENSRKPRAAKRSAEIRVRRARASDLPAIAALYDELHLKNYLTFRVPLSRMRRQFERIARDRRHHLLVADAGGRIAGTLHLIVVPHLGHGLQPFAIVENVVVAPDQRSMGIGERMLEGAAEIARRRGCYKAALTTNVVRKRAHKFYQRLGWRRTHFGYSFDLA